MLEENGVTLGETLPIPEIQSVSLPDPRPIPDAVVEAAGDRLRTDHEIRVRHSGGHSLPDLIVRRSGRLPSAPDGVILPEDESRIEKVLAACSATKVAVVPWGGGTSVVGALTVEGGPFAAVVALDMSEFTSFLIDHVSMTATLGAGLRGPEAEELLRAEGMTLGHFPQSFEYATVGGFAAARSAGQASSGYGRFDELVTSLRMVTPSGRISTPASPRSSAGPSILEMALGSEGALGVITDVTVRVRRIPEMSIYEGWLVRDFQEGCEAVRSLAQRELLPTVIRVSDLEETQVSLGMSQPEGLVGRAFDAWLKLRGREDGSLVITGFEGSRDELHHRRATVVRALSGAGAIRLGKKAGEGWRKNRFHGPYLREALLDEGLVVDTFETSAVWGKYGEAYERIRNRTVERLGDRGMAGIVMCHLSHCYPEAASLYFTVIATPGPDGPVESWKAVKRAAMHEISAAGLTVSHHHGVGRDHIEWLEREAGGAGTAALQSLKGSLDPAGIMNPGCLVPLPGSVPRIPR